MSATNESAPATDVGATGSEGRETFTMEELDRRMKGLLEVQKQLATRDPKEELSTAILLDRAHKVQQVLEANSELASEYTPAVLFASALSGKPALLKLAISMGADINTPAKDGMPALVSACRTRSTTNPEIWKTLLEHGVDVTAGDGHFSPLQKAINNEDSDLIRALVKHGVDPNQADDKGTPLYFSLHMNCVASFYTLLECKADPNLQHRGQSLLHYIPQHREIKEGVAVTEALLKAGAQIDAHDRKNMTPFLVAVSYGRLDLMKTLAENGANINAVDSSGGNAAWVFVNSAVGVHHPECITWLLQQGIDINQKVGKYETPVSRLQKFVVGVTDTDIYSTIANVFKDHGARFEDDNDDEDLIEDVAGKEEGSNL